MNIAIEAFALSLDKVTGIGNVALKYIEELQKLDSVNRYFVYTTDGLKHVDLHNKNWSHIDYVTAPKRAKRAVRATWLRLREAQSLQPTASRQAAIIILRTIKMIIEAIDRVYFPFWLALSFRKNRIDVYFGTYADFYPFVFPHGIRKLWLVHDLVWKLYPETQENHSALKGFLIRYKMKHADLLLSVSDNTKKDIQNILGIQKEIITLHNAADLNVFHSADSKSIARVKEKYGFTKPYILSVCTLEPRKNLNTLLAAYELIPRRDRYQLVLVGMSGWKNTKLFELIEKHPANDSIIVTGYVPTDDLAPLYTGAEVFVFPSLYEGFGMPILEAMQCGCPVISSTSSSIPEVAGDACILVDPLDVRALASSMEKVLSDKKLQDAMSRKGLAMSRFFSWEKSAALLHNIILSR